MLLHSGSADKTVKFWDLETFELIGSTGPEVYYYTLSLWGYFKCLFSLCLECPNFSIISLISEFGGDLFSLFHKKKKWNIN